MTQEQEKAKMLSELELAKKQITDNVKWTTEERKPSGGQTCGMPTSPVVLISEELNFSVKVGWHRSQLKNREIAFMLFQLALDEFVK